MPSKVEPVPEGYATVAPWIVTRDTAREYGAFMEPSGRNRWQLVASREAPKTAQTSKNRCRGLQPVAATPKW